MSTLQNTSKGENKMNWKKITCYTYKIGRTLNLVGISVSAYFFIIGTGLTNLLVLTNQPILPEYIRIGILSAICSITLIFFVLAYFVWESIYSEIKRKEGLKNE